MRISTPVIAVLTAAAGLAVNALAGPLNPPAGPVAPTMKTLSEVEPRKALSFSTAPGDNTTIYKITAPGSYYLAEELWVPPGMSGITIAAWPVTLDLNGFTVYGLQGSHEGITTGQNGGPDYTTVKNGMVTGFGMAGVNLGSTNHAEVRDVTSSGNISGILVGADGLLVNCEANGCYYGGFTVGDRCTVTGCRSTSNRIGFTAGSKDVFQSCTASENTEAGFSAGAQGTIRDCQALHNGQQGIVVTDSCTVTGNQCRANGATGYASIWANGGSNTIQNNQTADSGYGVYLTGNGNTVSGNTFTAPAQRIVLALGTNNLIVQNTAYNAPSGFQIPSLNRVGPIVQPLSNLLPITGLSYSTGLNTTDPYANLVIN